MIDYWEVNPPNNRSTNEVRLMLRSYFGVKDSSKTNRKPQTEAEFMRAFRELAGVLKGNA